MLCVDVLRHQYGVGQGCFHLQTLKFSGGKPKDFTYRFVYDCGGSKFQKTKTIDWCIDHATAGTQPLEIDAVYLSHFEDDHVNGVEELCKNANVSRIYAPHIDLNSAVHIISQQLAAGVSWTTSFQQFASTLFAIAGGGDIFGVPVIRISGGDNPPTGSELPINNLPRDLDDAEQVINVVTPYGPAVSHSIRIPVVASKSRSNGNGIQHRVVWEMVHWYYGSDDQLTLQILQEIALINGYEEDCMPGLKINASNDEVKAALQWMKINRQQIAMAFMAAMAAHNSVRAGMCPPQPDIPHNHNVASLCLYSGPVEARGCVTNLNSWLHTCINSKNIAYWLGHKGCSWIATGDAMLGIADVWNQFSCHFGVDRIDACSTVLIPHHGADASTSHNFTVKLLRENQSCVISAGAINSYHHPHRNVVQAILTKPAALQLVTETNPMGFVEYLGVQLKI